MKEIKAILSKASWILTALGSINWGLKPFNFDLFSIDFIRSSLGMVETPFYYLIGLAGLYSLITFFTGCGDSCEG